ncbi:uncharacterized protein G2W53_026843 [Senna tora]|uniref:Uncharacterized protein n=1 Tax=Senna tora TaxID=362788 RepID=A0A834WHT8_9FABA|nr:uncharacterized protein G2W53_026843 [Senna tora]
MSYAYLFKYIIIGDTGNFNSFSTLLIFDPNKTWVSELLCLADLGLRDFPSRDLSPLFALMHTCTLQEAEAILEDLSPSPLQIFGFGVALLAVPYALLDQKSLNQAHRYILFNCDDVQQYIREHEDIVNSHTGKRKWSKAKSHSNDFIEWFETRAMNDDISDFVKGISRGPNTVANKFSGYVINGYRFHTRMNGGQEFHWGEPSDSSSNPTLPVDDGEVDLVRTDVSATIIDQPLPTLDDQPHEIDYEEDSDFDDSDWDYME